jgi:dipeptidyl aminopeptidase/acylaminoacyl peptidase
MRPVVNAARRERWSDVVNAVLPFGSWPSPLSAASLAASSLGLEGVAAAGDGLVVLERRPEEAGRTVLVRWRPDGSFEDLVDRDTSVRTLVHEYGGGAVTVLGPDDVAFTRFDDQRVWRRRGDGEAVPLTPEPPAPRSLRYADGCPHPTLPLLYMVRERHEPDGGVHNEVVAVDLDGSLDVRVVAAGSDFVSSPRAAPDGSRLVWVAWDHPQMSWDGTELRSVQLDDEGRPVVGSEGVVAGSTTESVQQPRFDAAGRLHLLSDRTGWWNLYRVDDGDLVALCPMEAEVGEPEWVFGTSTYQLRSDGSVVITWSRHGRRHLGIIGSDGALTEVATPFTHLDALSLVHDDLLAVLAGSPTTPLAVALVELGTGQHRIVRSSTADAPDPAWVSVPEPIDFPTTGGRTAHAFFYPPRSPEVEAPPGERPPLVVMSHGGPTSATVDVYLPRIQFFTSRGIALVDVNYGGSTGYGREYRNQLRGQWGIVDVDDCIAAARALADQGRVDGARMAIRGGSAGGFTTLCALTFHDVFAAGCSLYGIADAALLAADTHKMESRYLDSLIGPYPEAAETYRARSPIHHVDRLSTPMLLLQGSEDPVVPPNQAEAMVAALAARGIPHAYLCFEGEQHGFRQAAHIVRAVEAELLFYAAIFGFEPADELEPLPIVGL